MSVDTKRKTLHSAICEYEQGDRALAEARRRKRTDSVENESGEQWKSEDALELERALSYNTGVAYWYLAEHERTKVSLNCPCELNLKE